MLFINFSCFSVVFSSFQEGLVEHGQMPDSRMQEEVKDIVLKSLQKARDHDRTGNVGKAYAYYTVVAELCPAKRSEIEEDFVNVLCEWGLKLERNKRFEDVALCYERSLDIFPKNPRVLNNFAAHMLRNNDPIRAIGYLKKALKIDQDFLPAERNLQNAFSMAVDRWHFLMLNDKRRNNAFERAIRKRIAQGYDTVLDVGTGTGLLSLYAKDAGARQVYACEYSSVMSTIANKVFHINNAKDIKLFPKISSDLEIPTDIPERVKLIVTETFDAGLFGELVIPSMINAHINLLNENGIIVPMRATLYIAAVECEYIRYRSSVVFDKLKESCSLNFEDVSVLPDDEYYDTENVENVKINYVTEPQAVLTVNFNDLPELQEFSRDGLKNTVHTRCRYDGTVDGLVTWFKLHLDEEIVIDSSEGKSCWQHAVFPSLPKSCKQDDVLYMKAEMSKGKLKCSYESAHARSDNSKKYKCLYRMPKDIIAFLNDFEYVKLLERVSRSRSNEKVKNILDTSPFPIYGLMLLKENVNTVTMYYKTDNRALGHFIEETAKLNGLDEKICILSAYNEIKSPLDVIFVHNFDIKGELRDCDGEGDHEYFRCFLSPNGILLPERVFLMGQLVFSEDLSKMVYVKDSNLQRIRPSGPSLSGASSVKNSDEEDEDFDVQSNVSGMTDYKIAECINEFKIDQVFDLNSSLYLYEHLSPIQELIEIRRTARTEKIVNFGRIKINNDTIRGKPLPNALICWYKIKVSDDQIYDTRRNGCFMNHAAVLLEDELKTVISKNQQVCIKVQQVGGLVKLKVVV